VLALAPFGFGNCEPAFAVLNAEVAGPHRPLGSKGVLVPVRQNGRTVMMKSWNPEHAAALAPGTQIDAVINIQEDEYSRERGYGGWCAVIRDTRPVDEMKIERLKSTN
jgi:RecJ OB domain